MKKNGFTLIELLAVIVILAIIASIATTIVLNIIEDSKKSTFMQTANVIIDAGSLYYYNQELKGDLIDEKINFTLPNDSEKLDLQNNSKVLGLMIIDKDEEIALAISNEKYCIRKDFDSEELLLIDDLENCIIPNYNINSDNICIKNTNILCEDGTKVTVQVNDYDKYNFYVIKDTGKEMTLIMDNNLGGTVSWDSQQYNSRGPINSLNVLEEMTYNWTNIFEYNYTLTDDSGANRYPSFEIKNAKARMLTKTEVLQLKKQNENIMPKWLYENLDNDSTTELQKGYWLSTAGYNFTTTAHFIYYNGSIPEYAGYDYMSWSNNYGIRPVIIVSKGIK